jgi:hypothetical protein
MTRPFHVAGGLPQAKSIVDIIQRADGTETGRLDDDGRAFRETHMSVFYRSVDGRYVIVLNGNLGSYGKAYYPESSSASGEVCLVQYFAKLADAEAFWDEHWPVISGLRSEPLNAPVWRRPPEAGEERAS